MATNLKDCEPFALMHREDLTEEDHRRWQECYQAGIELAAKGEHALALEQFRRAADFD